MADAAATATAAVAGRRESVLTCGILPAARKRRPKGRRSRRLGGPKRRLGHAPPEHIGRRLQRVQQAAASVPPEDQVVGTLTVPGRFEVHTNAKAPRPAATHVCSCAVLIEDRNVTGELVALRP